MRAFRYVDGALVECDWPHECVRVPLHEAADLAPFPPRTKRERRQRARHGVRGRRGVRRVVAPKPTLPYRLAADRFDVFRAHPFGDGARRVLLYLPEGERPTERHGRLLDRALKPHVTPPR